jgi:hypothetical protein
VHDFSSICMMIHPKVALFIHQYHLPSCLWLLEASHTIEILREAGLQGFQVHVNMIS